MGDLDNIVQRILHLSETTSDVAFKTEIVKQYVYKASNLLAVGTKIFPPEPTDLLAFDVSFPGDLPSQFPIAEGSRAGRRVLKWTPFRWFLQKSQASFLITDESVIKRTDQLQNRMSMIKAIESIAADQDAEIIDSIVAGVHTGAGYYVNIAGGSEWDTASGDPEADIVAARSIINQYSNVTAAELRNMIVLCHVNVSGELFKLQLINNVQQTLASYLNSSFGITILETRDSDLADAAYAIVPGMNTGHHMVYDGSAVPLSETERVMGVGWDYLVTKYFGTKVVPESASDTDNYRIVKINNTKS
jgi:hypothetical protein